MLSDFRAILVVIRNPYDLEVSRYFHLRKPEAFEKNEEREWACSLSFEEFQRASRFRLPRPANPKLQHVESIANYYQIDGHIPANLSVLRFEQLEEDLNECLSRLNYPHLSVKAVNVSTEREARTYQQFVTSAEIERIIHQRYAWVFDRGFYPRLPVSLEPVSAPEHALIAADGGRVAPRGSEEAGRAARREQ